MLLSHHQNAGQNHDIKISSRCSENVVQFRYLERTITNQNLLQEEGSDSTSRISTLPPMEWKLVNRGNTGREMEREKTQERDTKCGGV
jgi:hypothetical protein